MPIGKNIGKVTLKYWENVRPLMPDGNKRTYIHKSAVPFVTTRT